MISATTDDKNAFTALQGAFKLYVFVCLDLVYLNKSFLLREVELHT